MDVAEFDFDLPEGKIAQKPVEPRDSSKLMVLNRKDNSIEDKVFTDIIDYLKPGDVLVRNNTQVIPARLFGQKAETGGKVEFLLLTKVELDTWEVLVRPGKKVKTGTKVVFGENDLEAVVKSRTDFGGRVVEFNYQGVFENILDKLGEMPLPPYIEAELEEADKYQTVYAKVRGAAAAPTAGLHFTDSLLEKIKAKGIEIVDITLHVGLGTFRPVRADKVEEHEMHAEYYEVSKQTAKKINQAKENGNKVVTVGTTSTRTLETVAKQTGLVEADKGWTDIFIYPGYEFKAADALITNFHLPKSTLIMMISAFYDKEKIMNAYQHAIDNDYRFYSFGDAMVIIWFTVDS